MFFPLLLVPAGCQGQLLLEFLHLHLDAVHVHLDIAGGTGPRLLEQTSAGLHTTGEATAGRLRGIAGRETELVLLDVVIGDVLQ